MSPRALTNRLNGNRQAPPRGGGERGAGFCMRVASDDEDDDFERWCKERCADSVRATVELVVCLLLLWWLLYRWSVE